MDVDVVSVISRWVHVGTAIVLVGGAFFMRCVLHPALDVSSTELMTRVRARWKKFVHAGIALFLISGFYNYLTLRSAHTGDALYHALVGTKILLALIVFFLASALVGRSAGTQKLRDHAPRWMGVLLLLSAVIVGISGFVKVRGVSATKSEPTAISTEVPDMTSEPPAQ